MTRIVALIAVMAVINNPLMSCASQTTSTTTSTGQPSGGGGGSGGGDGGLQTTTSTQVSLTPTLSMKDPCQLVL